MVDDTIVAVSSPPGASARGIVRCSGPDAIGLAQSVFSPEAGVDIRAVPGFRRLAGLVHLERLCDVPGELYLFRGPRSYTRQDCVEFHVPGSSAVLAMLVERLIELGARAAEAGEFTARAFLSGAMDLVQAEAVAQVIRSRSDAQLRAAQRMMDGRLGGQIDGMLEQVAELVALVEADIDFAEEPIEFITPGQLQSRLSDIVGRLGRLIGGADSSERLDVLPQILLIGRPNAGKSTLMNRLSGVDRSICAPLAGTTRDLLLAPIRVGGHEAILLDAAGVDAETDALMVEAGSATTAAMSRVDLLCHVVDISRELDASVPAVDRASPRTPRVVVGNKIDIVDADTIAMRRRRLEDAGLGPVCPVSAKTGAGIDACRRALDDALTLPQSQVAEDVLLLTARQREAIERALAAIERCVAEAAEIDETIDRADILAFELREAMEALGSVCGSVATDDLLGRIFSSFCIGK